MFLRYDSRVDVDNRFFLFIYEDKLLRFSNPEILVIDATFRTVPLPFYQLLAVQAVFLDRCFPFACALMINKTEQSYKGVLKKF